MVRQLTEDAGVAPGLALRVEPLPQTLGHFQRAFGRYGLASVHGTGNKRKCGPMDSAEPLR